MSVRRMLRNSCALDEISSLHVLNVLHTQYGLGDGFSVKPWRGAQTHGTPEGGNWRRLVACVPAIDTRGRTKEGQLSFVSI